MVTFGETRSQEEPFLEKGEVKSKSQGTQELPREPGTDTRSAHQEED